MSHKTGNCTITDSQLLPYARSRNVTVQDVTILLRGITAKILAGEKEKKSALEQNMC